MKLQKVALILGLSVCIAGTQVQMTFGSEETAIEGEQASGQDEDQNKDQDLEEEKTEEEKTEEEKAEEEKLEEEKAKENQEEKTEEEKPGDQTNPEAADPGKADPGKTDTVKPDPVEPDAEAPDSEDNQGQKPDAEQPDQNENTGGNTEEGSGTTNPETPGPETPDPEIPDTEIPDSETPDNGTPDTENNQGETPDTEQPDDNGNINVEDPAGSETETPDPEENKNEETPEPEQPAPPEEESQEPEDTYTEPAAEDTYSEDIYSTYSASIKFLDDSEKIKYNVSVPIKGLPSFITQEMIVAALKCQDETGYPASVTIAQIIQESGFGKYGPGGEDGKGLSYLAYQYNNLFGIKGTGPAGSVDMITGEQSKDGSMFTIVSGFRVYDTYTECIEDRTELLKEVYSDLTLGVDDANTFAMKIGSRWATSLTYGQSLIRQMEEYDLYRLDDMTLGEFSNLLGTFVNPCPGAVLTSNFGLRDEPIAGAGNGHNGIDLGTGAYNIPTYAAAAGTVTYAGEAGTAGNLIIIDHGKGLITKYMHHEKIFVEEGQKVEKGQQIGLSGTTGMSTGNHLHFQVEKNGTPVDPMQFFTLKQQESFYE